MEKTSLSPRIETPRLILQKHDTALAPLMFSQIDRDRSRLQEFLPWVPYMKSKQDELQYILSTHERWKDGTLFDYSLLKSDDQSYVGTIGVHTIDWKAHRCELGYWLLSKYEGQGLMTEAVRHLEKHLFEKGFQRIEIRCDPKNSRSANIPISCGYLFEAHMRHETTLYDLARDTWVFSKLKQNYQQVFVSEMTALDFAPLIAIAKASPEHFTVMGLELLGLDLQNQKGLVLRAEDRVMGFVSYFSNQGKAEIGWMAVSPFARSQGYGKKLLNCLKERLKLQNCKKLEVRTLGEEADYKPYDRTRSFYLRNGFKKIQSIAHKDNPEWPEELVLSCDIEPGVLYS